MEPDEFDFYKKNQVCQDQELTEKFCNLHEELVNKVIEFCKENDVKCDAFSLWITGIQQSAWYGGWTPGTDSCCSFYTEPNDKKPFLQEL